MFSRNLLTRSQRAGNRAGRQKKWPKAFFMYCRCTSMIFGCLETVTLWIPKSKWFLSVGTCRFVQWVFDFETSPYLSITGLLLCLWPNCQEVLLVSIFFNIKHLTSSLNGTSIQQTFKNGTAKPTKNQVPEKIRILDIPKSSWYFSSSVLLNHEISHQLLQKACPAGHHLLFA